MISNHTENYLQAGIMELPKFHETFNPILDILKEGETLHHRELIKRVINKYYFSLPKEQLEQRTKSGDILIDNRISWGKSYLKKAGYIEYPERGMVKITEKGNNALNKKIELKDLEDEPGFRELDKEEKRKNLNRNAIKGSSPQDLIDSGFFAIETQVKNELLERLRKVDAYYFEKVILILLKKMGYGDFIETPKSGDQGIDGIINQDKLGLDKIYIQAKRYNESKVREKDIRNFIGAMSGDTSKGVFVTTSAFDDSAQKKAHDAHHTIVLIDGARLAELMYRYGVGVQIQNVYEVKELDEDFFENN